MNFEIIREFKAITFSILKTSLESIRNFQEQVGDINGGTETPRKNIKQIFFSTTLHGLGILDPNQGSNFRVRCCSGVTP